jgi:hypothetical protein
MSVGAHYRATVLGASVRQTQASLILTLLMFAAYVFLARVDPELRYTRYALPGALATLWLARRAQERSLLLLTAPLTTYAAMAAAVCVWSAVAIGVTSSFYPRFFEEALLLAAPLGAAMICASLKRDDSEWPFYALLAILGIDYFWEIGLATIVDAIRQPATFTADLIQSTAASESVRAFSFGVLAVFFLARRHLPGAVLSVLLALVAGKRIVVLGLLAALPLVFLAPSLERPRRRALVTLVAVALNIATAMSLRNLDDWGIADRIQEVTLQSADVVLMGRAKLYALLADRLPATPVVGAGLGRITHVLEAESAWLTNTHSDVLKHFIELGPVMFAGWIGCFYWTSRRKSTLALTVFMNVLFLSDNVSIYFDVMFPFYLSFAYLDQQRTAVQPRQIARRRPTCLEPVRQAA